MQPDFYLWTTTAPLALMLALVGCIVFELGRVLERPILSKMLSHGTDDRPGIEDVAYHETSFTLSCWSFYSSNTHTYERSIMVLKITGSSLGSLSALIYLWEIFLALGIGVVLLIQLLVFYDLRAGNLREKAIRMLDEWHTQE